MSLKAKLCTCTTISLHVCSPPSVNILTISMCLLHAFIHCLFDSILSWFLYYTLFLFPFKAFISSLTSLDPVSTQESLIFFEGVLNSTTNYNQL